MSFQDFQAGHHDGNLGYWNGINSKSPCYPNASHQGWAQSDLQFVEQTWFDDFQDGHHGGHLRYQNRVILAILNLYVAPMSHIKFQLNPTYSLIGDVV